MNPCHEVTLHLLLLYKKSRPSTFLHNFQTRRWTTHSLLFLPLQLISAAIPEDHHGFSIVTVTNKQNYKTSECARAELFCHNYSIQKLTIVRELITHVLKKNWQSTKWSKRLQLGPFMTPSTRTATHERESQRNVEERVHNGYHHADPLNPLTQLFLPVKLNLSYNWSSLALSVTVEASNIDLNHR